jgi:tetratricopeptide (TPR) repeat protein
MALLAVGERVEATELFERGLAAAQVDCIESNTLRCLSQLAAVTGSADLRTQADSLLGRAASMNGAWIPGFDAYLALSKAWLESGEPDHAREVLEPLLTVARATPWIPVLAEALVVEGSALASLGRRSAASAALHKAAKLAVDHGMPPTAAAARAALGTLR